MTAYYNENDPYAAEWLRNLVAAGLIAPGEVDERSIVDVRPVDLVDFTQCHFFAGIGGWSLSARIAGWPDDRPLWTGSCPCQPFSVAGLGRGHADERHLWPEFFRLINAFRPPVIMGEQVAAAVGKAWLDGVCVDLEGIGYAVGAVVAPACAVDAPHRRDRLWFVADCSGSRRDVLSCAVSASGQLARAARGGGLDRVMGDGCSQGLPTPECSSSVSARWREEGRATSEPGSAPLPGGSLVDGESVGRSEGRSEPIVRRGRSTVAGAGSSLPDGDGERQPGRQERDEWEIEPRQSAPFWHNSLRSGPWGSAVFAIGADGKARRVEPGIRLLAHGVSGRVAVRGSFEPTQSEGEAVRWVNRVGTIKGFGNAIVPEFGAEVIAAFMECRP